MDGTLIMCGAWLFKSMQDLGAALVLNTMKVRLFTNELTPGPQRVLADLVVPTYTGYADSGNLAILGYGINTAGDAFVHFAAAAFIPADGVTPALIRGWGLYHDSAVDTLATLFLYDTPVPLTDQNDVLVVQPRVMLGQPVLPTDAV